MNACNMQRPSDFSGNEKEIFAENLDIGFLIGTPVEPVIFDSLLIYFDRFNGQTITIFDVKNERFVQRFLNEGQGPGEVTLGLLKLFVSHDEKKVCFFHANSGRVYMYELADIITQNNIQTPQQVLFRDRPANIKKTKNGYVGIGMFDDGRYRLYDSEGNMISAFGKYPFSGEDMDHMGRFFIYQGHLCASSDGNYFAMGSSYCDNLEFYKLENGTAVLIKKYETYDAKVQFNNVLQINDDCIINYRHAYGGKYCYMLYSGKTHLENDRKSSIGGTKIIVFDWNGNYIRSYKTDVNIISFCVDEENNIIYATTRDDEDGFIITKFNL